MNMIGKLEGGKALVLLDATELRDLQAVARWAGRIADDAGVTPALPGQAPAESAATKTHKAPRHKEAQERKPKAPSATATCRVCGKPLANTRFGRKTCEGACTMQYRRDYGREKWRQKHGVKHPRGPRVPRAGKRDPAPPKLDPIDPPNPSDPSLTDEQRKALRLEMIRRSAERTAGK